MQMTVICLGTNSMAYGPFPVDDAPWGSIADWVKFHCLKEDVDGIRTCRNGISEADHLPLILFPHFCRMCGALLNHDQDNRPSDITLCDKHSLLQEEADLGMV